MDISGGRGYHAPPLMKVFHCDHCGQLLFFENVACMSCGRTVAYVPQLSTMASLDRGEGDLWRSPLSRGELRLCRNWTDHDVCNWALAAASSGDEGGDGLCRSCRLTRTIPDLSRPGNARLWYKLEVAKRRLVYTLDQLGLWPKSRVEDPEGGLCFDFLADPDPGSGAPPVMTGHAEGLITVNLAEADDAERVRRRIALNEPYRTLLGHFRHESGHYYWDRLVRGSDRVDAFRELFGDERDDYDAALKRHYDAGPGAWQDQYISAYATMHPWEDWAETWAHYLHMADTLEMAAACGLSIEPPRSREPRLGRVPDPVGDVEVSFGRMIDGWAALTYVLNNLNRGLGNDDAYPFVLPPRAVDKLRFVHEVIAARAAKRSLPPPGR
jgi:hypothetical protein